MDNLSEMVSEVFDCTFILDNGLIHRNFIPSYNNHEVKRLSLSVLSAAQCHRTFLHHLEGLRQTPPQRVNGGSPQPRSCSRGKCCLDNVSEPHTARDREEAIETETLTQTICFYWHNHVLGYVSQCLDKEDIFI